MEPQNRFDIVIAGAGLSGLTLALELVARPQFRDKKILLLDRDQKNKNDRTWCFWATEAEPLPPVLFKTWPKCQFFGDNFEKSLDIAPFRYCMVRGLDFYNFAKNELQKHPNLSWQAANIERMDEASGQIFTDQGIFSGEWIFNSAFTPLRVLPSASGIYSGPPFSVESPRRARQPKAAGTLLLQHFMGWTVCTNDPVFAPDTVTFMDFRVQQHGQARFVYVLPFSETEALVEFTVFSPDLLPEEEYEEELKNYLQNYLKIKQYKVLDEEFGVIPMTDFSFDQNRTGRVIRIGTAGGFVKGSSGYAFKRTQRKIRRFVENWADTGVPDPVLLRSPRRFQMYDNIFLRVFRDGLCPPRRIFTSLFRRQSARNIFRFLDEDTTFAEEPAILLAAPFWPFLKAFFRK